MKKYSDLVNKQFKVNKRRNTYTVIGIILGIILFTTVGYINYFMRDVNIAEAKYYRGNYGAIIKGVTDTEIKVIEGNVKISNCGLIAEVVSNEIMVGNIKKQLLIYALDNTSFENIFNERIKLVQGRLPREEEEIALTIKARGELNKEVNDEINIGNRTYKIVGFYKGEEYNSMKFTGITKYNKDEKYSDINAVINIKDNLNIRETILGIVDTLGISNSKVQNRIEFNEMLIKEYESYGIEQFRNLSSEKLGLVLINIFILLLTSILTYGSINVSMKERIQYFSVLRCMGATVDKIRYLLIKESFILGALSIIPGLIIGHLVGWTITSIVFGKVIKLNIYGIGYKIYWQVVIATILLTIVTILISSILPIIKSGNISPIKGVKIGGIRTKGLKKRKSKLIRKLFGYKGELAYKNIRGNNKSFIISIITLSMLLIIFVSFTGYCTGALKGFNKELEKTKDFKISLYISDLSSEYSNLDSTNKIEVGIKRLEDIRNFIDSTESAKDVITEIGINLNPILKGFRSRNIIKDEKIFNKDMEEYSYLKYSKLSIYSDEALKEILPYIQGEDVRLEDFNDNGVLLVNKNVNSKLLRIESEKVSKLQPNDKFYLYLDNEYNINSMDLGEVLNDTSSIKEIQAKVVGTIDVKNTYDWRNNDIDIGVMLIASREFYEKNKKIINDRLDYSSTISLEFNFLSQEKRNNSIDDIKAYINEIGGSYIDNEIETLELKNQIVGIAIIIYTILFLSMAIGVINIINNKNINITLRKKEIGTMLSIGMNSRDLKKMIMLEGIVQWFISSIMGGGISYVILKIIYISYAYMGNIENSNPPVWIIFVGSFLLLLINLVTSALPLNRLNKLNTIELIREEE
ncbi:MAG: FtsX-like permease family protein [Clostridium sp.]|uniref:ABC transporter permease n=1 Tax=Clostridium sp. TaxID=1506 RepID=UPI0030424A1A